MMTVLVSGSRPRGLKAAAIESAVAESFRRAKRPVKGSVSVRFVDVTEMTRLNREYRGKNRPTDVLSFSATEGDFPVSSKMELDWGDIIVCTDVATTEAERRSIPVVEELIRLISHGTLHLLGYDHATEEDEFHMFSLQEAVVERITARP